MTIGGWIICGFLTVMLVLFSWVVIDASSNEKTRVFTIVIAVVLIIALWCSASWYFHSTASGQRALTDQKSELNGGLDRTITVYTANGDVIASYTGKIDIEANDGGYIKFDYEGNRYIYYNCFVESIAKIN